MSADAEGCVGQGGYSVPLSAGRWPADVDGVDEVDEHELRWETIDLTQQIKVGQAVGILIEHTRPVVFGLRSDRLLDQAQ